MGLDVPALQEEASNMKEDEKKSNVAKAKFDIKDKNALSRRKTVQGRARGEISSVFKKVRVLHDAVFFFSLPDNEQVGAKKFVDIEDACKFKEPIGGTRNFKRAAATLRSKSSRSSSTTPSIRMWKLTSFL